MILDKEATFCESIPAVDQSDWVDLIHMTSEPSKAEMGLGEPILILVTGQNLVLDADPDANPPRIRVDGRYDDGAMAGPEMTISVGPHILADGGVIFGLPTSVAPSVRLTLENMYTGRWSAFVVFKAV